MADEPGFLVRYPRRLIIAVIVVVVAVGIVLDRNEPTPEEPDPGTFAVAFLGDAPYYAWEDIRFRRLLRQLNASELAAVVSVGDIFWRPCSDEMYFKHREYFDSVRHPVIYTPGDNEWADCHEPRVGGYEPLDRLAKIREVFFADPARSLGDGKMELASQGASPPFEEYVENARFELQGIVFATVHLVGSRNASEPFPGRTAADDEESTRRTAAAAAWVRAAFTRARETAAPAVVIITHANAAAYRSVDDPERRALEPFLGAFEAEAAAYAGPVVFVNGDWHEYVVDKPFVVPGTGRMLENVTRVQVPGSPDVGWVRMLVSAQPVRFEFELYIMPSWKVW